MQSVAFVAYPGVLASSITMPAEILSAANQVFASRNRQRFSFRLDIATLDNRSVVASCGLAISPTRQLSELHNVDLLVLPTIWRNPRSIINRAEDLLPLLQVLQQRGSLLCGVGSATCLLAEAGLLDNKPATTHWFFLDFFSKRYPDVKLQRKHLITQADNVYCAGSINSVADLMVHIAERFYGPDIAHQVEGQFSPEIRRSYSSQRYLEGEANRHQDEQIVELQQWLHDNYAEAINFAILGKNLGVSQRSLNRRFKAATDQTPVQYLQRLRLDAAKDLLLNSNLTISEIAFACGFNNLSYFSASFNRKQGISPGRYRQSVRGKLFTPDVPQ